MVILPRKIIPHPAPRAFKASPHAWAWAGLVHSKREYSTSAEFGVFFLGFEKPKKRLMRGLDTLANPFAII